jgi:hypothetical protein
MHDEPESAHGRAESGSTASTGASAEEAVTVPLSPEHDVSGFRCKKSAMVQDFLPKFAASWVAARCSCVFVLPSPDDPKKIWGYYTLSASLIVPDRVDPRLTASMPKLPIPMALIGFMGRDDSAPKGVGAGLIADAAKRVASVRSQLAIWGIWLNCETEGKLMDWYQSVGFTRAIPKKPSDPPMKAMWAPLETLLVA